MGVTNEWQLFGLFLAAGLGFLLGLVFDLLRVFRNVFHSSAFAVFWQDVLFSVFSAVSVFFFLLPLTGGVVRVYLLLSVLSGTVVYLVTLGRILPRSCRRAVRWIRRLTAPVKRVIEGLSYKIRTLGIYLSTPLCRTGRFCAKKVKIFIKKGLHIGR